MLEEATTREQRDLRLLRRYRTLGDRAAHEELVQRFTPLVRATARKYAGRGEELEDLVQVGLLALVKAIDGFDLSRGHRFVSYAAPTISGEIKRHFRDHLWAVHVPRSTKELQARISGEEARIERRGDVATDAELARRLDATEAEVRDARVASRCFRVHSLSHPAGTDVEYADRVGRTEAGYGRVEDAAMLDDAMQALDERERAVVRMRYRDELLQREIAPHFDVSQMQVSRILTRATDRMRERLQDGDAPLAA